MINVRIGDGSRDGVRDEPGRRFTDEDRESWGRVKFGLFISVNGNGDVGRLVYGRCIPPPGGTTRVGDSERLSRTLFLSMTA